jgi:hypothetical protein
VLSEISSITVRKLAAQDSGKIFGLGSFIFYISGLSASNGPGK